MKNFIQDGNVLELTAPFTVVAGQCILNGRIAGVAIHDAANGAPVQCAVLGVFELWKANPATVFAKGQLVYVTPAAVVTDANGGGANIIVGAAIAASAGGVVNVRVRLSGAPQLA